ncbi:uncharacterized protein [Medicago truncatula]|nr:uncharacterized protein LOC11407668 [Medicago truncatula]
MANFITMYHNPPIDHFRAVKLSIQDRVEVQPEFVEKYKDDLQDPWNIMNMDGGMHQIKFKIGLYNPTLKDGWEPLQQYHHFPDNVDIIFGYYGNNLFKVIMFREVFCATKIPSFHSRSMYPEEVIIFDIHISDNDLNTPIKMLPNHFGTFLQNDFRSLLTLCCDDGTFYFVDIIHYGDYVDDPNSGIQWNDFILSNYIVAGQKLRFKFDLTTTYMCHVFPIDV